jgi:predicted phage tail protein
MQQVVRLLGDLGERYGAEHTYHDLRTPADAIKLLCINLPELQEELLHAHEHGVGYRLIQAGLDLGYEDLSLPLGSNDLILTPVITGSGGGGGGVGQVLAGVGLVAFAILTAGAGAGFLGLGAGLTAGTFTLGAAASTAIGAVGTSLILGGVSQMLSPQPVVPNASGFAGPRRLSSGEAISSDGPQSVVRGSDGRQSYLFTGAANTVGVGATIPVVYGQVITGSHLLSARVEVADDSDPLKTAIKDPGTDTVLVGGETISGLTYASGLRTRKWDYSSLKPISSASARTLTLSEGNNVFLPENDPKEDIRADNYMVFFELDRGLYDYVSGPGTTLVDGFITYKVELSSRPDEGGSRNTVGSIQGTVQGLLTKNQPYRWMHYISYAQITDAKDLRTQVSIVDFRGNGRLRIIANGYELFKNKNYWEVPVA